MRETLSELPSLTRISSISPTVFDDEMDAMPSTNSTIVELELNYLKFKLKNLSIQLNWSNEVTNLIAIEGFNPEFGARPIKRTVRDLVENYISDMIMKNEIIEGNYINLDVQEKELSFKINQ